MRAPTNNTSHWLSARAAITPERSAVTDEDRSLDYAALEARTAKLAGWLRQSGVGPGHRVALLLGNRTTYLEAIFATARLGALAVPLNNRLAPLELRELIDDCRPTVLLHEASLQETIDRACRDAVHAPRVRLRAGGDDEIESALAAATPLREVLPVHPEDPMILMYTSGTTGAPKGALLPHRKTLFNSLNACLFFDLTADDRVLVALPLFHSFGLLILALPTLYAGGHVELHSRFDADAVWTTVEERRITFFGGVPTMFQSLLDALDERVAGVPESLRFLFTAGAAVPIELIHAFEARGLVLKQGYGQTETSILCCLEERDAIRKAGSVGRPVLHAELRVARTDTLPGPPDAWKDAAPGETGEIVVRGPITMLGYWERPDATAETLREGGWLRTGDLATMDEEGFVKLVGRARDLYISGGENVYPAQVEAAYAEHPAIREIAVVGVPDERWGEVGEAHIVLEQGAALDPEGLRAWGQERLAGFKLPARFIVHQELPRTASGKVQKPRLAGATSASES